MFISEIEQTRARLRVLYREGIAPELMRERKRAELEGLKKKLEGQERYRNLVPNNAFIASFATYSDLVPTYEHMLREEGGDLERFYARVKKYAASPPGERGPLSKPGR